MRTGMKINRLEAIVLLCGFLGYMSILVTSPG
jgi:hypothetical protein